MVVNRNEGNHGAMKVDNFLTLCTHAGTVEVMETDTTYTITISSNFFDNYDRRGLLEELIAEGLVINKETKATTTITISEAHRQFFISDINYYIEYCDLESSEKRQFRNALSKFESAQ